MVKISRVLILIAVLLGGCGEQDIPIVIEQTNGRYLISGETNVEVLTKWFESRFPEGTDWKTVSTFLNEEIWHHGGHFDVMNEPMSLYKTQGIKPTLKESPRSHLKWEATKIPIDIDLTSRDSKSSISLIANASDRGFGYDLWIKFKFSSGHLVSTQSTIFYDGP